MPSLPTEPGAFRAAALSWLTANAALRSDNTEGRTDRIAVFGGGTREEERARFDAARAWQRRKYDAGFGALAWPERYGGAGLPQELDDEFRRLEEGFAVPGPVEVLTISLGIESPTILSVGTDAQRRHWLPLLRRTDLVCCQLFSEPGAGSDLGALATSAVPDGEYWVLNGQKVWTSGAHLADHGVIICRSDPYGSRQRSMTAFLLPMDAPGVTIKPIRQMTDGTGFNEVFLDDVRVSDELRLGEVGGGWSVAMTILGFERAAVARDLGSSGTDLVDRLVALAHRCGRAEDTRVRARLTDLYVLNRTRTHAATRILARAASGIPGSESSLLKLTYSRELRAAGDLAADLLGPAFAADTGEWGTFAWSELAAGVPGVRLGGGTDEIQKTTLAERVLGMPRESR